jgi:hypothetical protein
MLRGALEDLERRLAQMDRHHSARRVG